MNLYRQLRRAIARQAALPSRMEQMQEALGRIEAKLNESRAAVDPRDFEFKVYSQWGEDGIIDHLVTRVPVPERSFVEFGVESYTEANTIFLLKHRYWRGLVIDGSAQHVDAIRKSNLMWRYHLMAECAFITRTNINELISRHGFQGDLGLLSVDIDGNDYWVWEAIDVVRPRIVVAEYNSLFGPHALLSTPYRDDFHRKEAHASNMYYGASISALTYLARRRGYTLVAGNSAGNNVFFVRDDCLGTLAPQTPEQAYVQAAFREAKDPAGLIQHLSFAERCHAIGHLPVVNVDSGRVTSLHEALR